MKSQRARSSPSRGHLLTEQRLAASARLDALSLSAAFEVMNRQDRSVPRAVARAKPQIIKAIRCVTNAWRMGGRLIYVGAGTSGRLGVLDASECPPTFGSDPNMVRGVIAGGRKALWRSVEGAEDCAADGARAIRALRVSSRDVVCGIAAGGTTPYVHAALAEAHQRRAVTLFLACVPTSQVKVKIPCDVDIRVLVGPEVLTGSTRLKAGTATKLVLNTITTLSMVQFAKTYGNLMVDLNSYACRKLTDRATRVIQTATGLSRSRAAALLHTSRGRAKTALVMHFRKTTRLHAQRLLDRHAGSVRKAIEDRSA